MFPDYIPDDACQLTENTSIAMAKNIQVAKISNDFFPEAIKTTFVQQGNSTTPILLLHGFDSSVLEFRRLFPKLVQQQETWAIDLLGFGFNNRLLDLRYNNIEIKKHLYYFWQQLIKKPVILVGASMGGAAAIDFTLEYPDIVTKLVLLDSAGLAKQPIISKFMFPPLDYWATEFLRSPQVRRSIMNTAYYDKSWVTEDAELCGSLHLKCQNWSSALSNFTKSGGYGSFTSQLPSIQQETLIIWGKQDKILPPINAEKFAQLIPNQKLVWIDKCGHIPHLEQSEITAQKIIDFL